MSDEKQYTEVQPKHNDPIIHCGHLGASNHHFFKVSGEPIKFCRPDGTFGKAEWLVACNVCWEKAKGDLRNIRICGDGTWIGDEPAITKTEDTGRVYENKIDPLAN